MFYTFVSAKYTQFTLMGGNGESALESILFIGGLRGSSEI